MTEEIASGMLRAMALVVQADGQGQAEETEELVAIWTERVGRPLEQAALEQVIAESSEAHARWLEEHAEALGDAGKREVLGAAVQICMADAELQDAELALLSRLARALDVAPTELRAVMNQVWRASRG